MYVAFIFESHSMEQAVSNFLKSLGVPVSEHYVQKLISAHPDFPSLLSISDTLHRLGVDHAASRVAKEDLSGIAFPYLLPLDKGRGDMLLVKNRNDLSRYLPQLDQWGGVVIQAMPAKEVKDRINNELYKKENGIRNFSMGLAAVTIVSLSYVLVTSFSFSTLALLVTAVAGAATGYFLLAKDLGVSYAAIDAFCNAGKNTNCDRVLKADIQLLGIHFSDAVVIYFGFQLAALSLALLMPGIKGSIDLVLAGFSLLTLPVMLFSLYYQYAVVKTWCRLCLVVVAILTVQLIIFTGNYFTGSVVPIQFKFLFIVAITLLLAAIALTVMLAKTIIQRANIVERVGMDGNRVKHSISVFNHLLMQQKKIGEQPFEKEMLLGSVEAPVKIIMVSNLYCNPCKLKHEVIDQLVALYPDKVSVALRFMKSGRDEGSVSHLLGYWHHAIYGKENESNNTANLMHHWFELWDFEKFKKKYSVTTDGALIEGLEAQHYAWINEAEVRLTPTFFVNGYELPKEYSIDDLLALTPSLADFFERNAVSEMTLQHAEGVAN